MMMAVDASAAVAAFAGHGQARDLLSDNRVVAPHLIDAEFMSALRKLVLRKELPARAASAAITAWVEFELERLPTLALNEAIWRLRDNLTPYDGTYVALARQLGIPLLTFDHRLAAAGGHLCDIVTLQP